MTVSTGHSAVSLKAVLGRFATGVAAVTGLDARTPVGLVVNSFTSVSLEPPLVSFCVADTSTSWPRVRRGEGIVVSFLAAGQLDLAHRLARSGEAKFRGVPWSPSPAGMPIPDGALAWLECSVEAEHPAGDHVIVVARIHRLAGTDAEDDPLVRYRGAYGSFTLDADSLEGSQ